MRPRPQLQPDVVKKIVTLYDRLSAVGVHKHLKANGIDVTYAHVLATLHEHVVVRSRSEATRTSVMKTTRVCKHCRKQYVIMNNAQVYCRTCCPTKSAYQRLKYYELSQPEFDAMIKAQNSLCALCPKPLVHGGSTNLNVDHCHVTGRVRGIVCHKCNMMIGFVDGEGWFDRLQRLNNYIANGHLPQDARFQRDEALFLRARGYVK
jgi:hypothetical protein